MNFSTEDVEEHDQERISTIIDEIYSLKDAWKKAKREELSETIFEGKKEKNLLVALLQKKVNYNYGLSVEQQLPYVIPYSGSNKPSEKSSFADYWFSLGLSVKFYLEQEFQDFPNWVNSRQKEQMFRFFSI